MSEVPNQCQHVSYEYVAGASKFHTRNWCIRCGEDMPTTYQAKEDEDAD